MLDRQGKAIQPDADFRNRPGIGGIEDEIGQGRRGPLHEQRDCIAANWSNGGSCVGSGRGSGGTEYSHSPRRCSGVRLVTRVFGPALAMGGRIRHVASAAFGCLVGSRDNDLEPRQP